VTEFESRNEVQLFALDASSKPREMHTDASMGTITNSLWASESANLL